MLKAGMGTLTIQEQPKPYVFRHLMSAPPAGVEVRAELSPEHLLFSVNLANFASGIKSPPIKTRLLDGGEFASGQPDFFPKRLHEGDTRETRARQRGQS